MSHKPRVYRVADPAVRGGAGGGGHGAGGLDARELVPPHHRGGGLGPPHVPPKCERARPHERARLVRRNRSTHYSREGNIADRRNRTAALTTRVARALRARHEPRRSATP